MRSLLFGIGICLLLNLDLFKFKGRSKYFNYKKFTTWVKEAIKLYHFMIRPKVKNDIPFRLWHQKSLLYYLLLTTFTDTRETSGDLGDLRPDGHGDVNDTRTFDWLSLGHGGILGRSLVVSNVTYFLHLIRSLQLLYGFDVPSDWTASTFVSFLSLNGWNTANTAINLK